MLQKFEVHGIHTTVDEKLRNYVNKKIGGLDHYISRHSRLSAHGEVKLKEGKTKNNNHCSCEVTLYLPNETINIEESALNMYAAVDIVESKLKQRLQKYKDQHGSAKLHRKLAARFRLRSRN